MTHASLVDGWMSCAGLLVHPSLYETPTRNKANPEWCDDLGDAMCLLVMLCCLRFGYFNVPEVGSLVYNILNFSSTSMGETLDAGVSQWYKILSSNPSAKALEAMLCLKPPGAHSCALYIPESDSFCLNVALHESMYCPEHQRTLVVDRENVS